MKRSGMQGPKLRRRRERGVALIFCLFALIVLTSIALGMIYLTDTETITNNNFRSTQQAYFGAMAGIEEMRTRMTPGMAGGIAVPTILPGTGAGSVVYILNPTLKSGGLEVINPMDPTSQWFDGGLCHENYPGTGLSNTGTGIPCTAAPSTTGWWTTVSSTSPFTSTTAALNFKWVRVNLKVNATDAPYYVDGGASSTTYGREVCWDGKNQVVKPTSLAACDSPPDYAYKPVYIVTSMAQGSRRVVQVEVAQNPPMVTNAAVDSQDHVTLNGQLGVNGYDYCTCQPITDSHGNITGYASRPGKTCDNTKWGIYSASTVENPNSSETIVAGPNPPIAQNQPWNYDIPQLVNSYKMSAGTVDVRKAPYNWACYGTSTHLDCGTKSSVVFGVPPTFPPSPVDSPIGPANMAQQFTYVPGDLQITGGSIGNGVLVVDGDLVIHGGLQFYGLILVRGVVQFEGGGSDKTNIFGAVLAGQQSIDDTVLGGSAVIQFDVCSLLNNRPPQPPTIISFRELPY